MMPVNAVSVKTVNDGEVEAMNATFLSAQRADSSHVITPAPSHGSA